MSANKVFQKDLLYPTSNIAEPGSMHVEIFDPTKEGRIPVVVESRTLHSPVEYINSIVQIMQSDIFDRIHVDIKRNVKLYIKSENGKYLLVTFDTDKVSFTEVSEIG